MCISVRIRPYGSLASRRAPSAARAFSAARHGRRIHSPALQQALENAPVGAIVVHHQHLDPGRIVGSAVLGGDAPASTAVPSLTVKWKRCRCRARSRPRSAAHHLDQPLARWSGPVRCRRYLRVVEVSAWLNASKIGVCLSGGMPMPVSRHDEVQRRRRRLRAPRPAP